MEALARHGLSMYCWATTVTPAVMLLMIASVMLGMRKSLQWVDNPIVALTVQCAMFLLGHWAINIIALYVFTYSAHVEDVRCT